MLGKVTLLEEVARALAKEDHVWAWDDLTPRDRDYYHTLARAALEAVFSRARRTVFGEDS